MAWAFSHVPACVDNTQEQQSTEEHEGGGGEDKSSRHGARRGEWLTPACA